MYGAGTFIRPNNSSVSLNCSRPCHVSQYMFLETLWSLCEGLVKSRCKPFKTVGRNMDFKSASSEISERNKERVIGNYRSVLCCKEAENLGKLFPVVVCEAELVSIELEYLAEEVSKQSVKVWLGFS